MPQVRDIALNELTEGGNSLGVAGTRVDAAHSLGDSLASLPPLAEMPFEQAITDLLRVEGAVQLQLQADQLAAHLDRRRQELEQREAQLNARQAGFEQELREARLWLVQRNDELNEREARLEARDEGFRIQGSELGTEAHDTGDAPVRNAPSGVSPPDAPPGDPRRFSESPWQERKDALMRKSEELDRRRLELEEFRDEASQMHQEALELRSAAEELRAQLCGSLETATADSALAAVRERMAQRYRNEAAYLTRRRNELEWLKKDLAEEHAKLEQRYQEVQFWIAKQKEVLGLGS